MTPEQLNEFNRMKEELEILRAATDPVFIEAIKRFLTPVSVNPSSKGATAENQSVSEAGSASYSVLGVPDGFIEVGGYNVPYYN